MAKHIAKIENREAEPLYEHFQPHNCGTINNIRVQILEALAPNPNDDNAQIEQEQIRRKTSWIQCQIEQDHSSRYKLHARIQSHNPLWQLPLVIQLNKWGVCIWQITDKWIT